MDQETTFEPLDGQMTLDELLPKRTGGQPYLFALPIPADIVVAEEYEEPLDLAA